MKEQARGNVLFNDAHSGDWTEEHICIFIYGYPSNREACPSILAGNGHQTRTHNARATKEARPYSEYINDIVSKAVLLDTYGMGIEKSQNSLLMHSLYAVADIGTGPEVLKLYVEEMNDPVNIDTTKRAYKLFDIEKANGASARVQGKSPSSVTNTPFAINRVADLFAYVKRLDGNFMPDPPEQDRKY